MTLKTEILIILSPIFGEDVRAIVEDHFDDRDSRELFEMAYHMLEGYMGANSAKRVLEGLKRKYHI